ncbi:MAG: HYR domain-containing protein [Chloroflexi bacterium]|nr:MAG: HYR domain-containing protein [Chloroflexota bacterium]
MPRPGACQQARAYRRPASPGPVNSLGTQRKKGSHLMTHPNTTRLSSRLRLLCGLALLLGLCIMLGGLARPAHAQSTLSVSDCSSDAQLQAEVAQANSDNAGDVITFACSGDIKLSSTLSINGSMTLSGSGQSVTLDGGDSIRVLLVNSVSFTLNALTIAHGSVGDGGGGLASNGGTLSISNSTFAYNFAGTVDLNSGTGGGLSSNGTTLSISNSTFAHNSAFSGGGGLIIYGESGTVSISNSTIANNSASGSFGGGEGGGIFNALDFNVGTMTITNSTIANNSTGTFGDGAGIYNNSSSTMSISNSTIAYNSAPSDGFGGGLANDGTMSLSGSIVADNPGGDCTDNTGSLFDQGYNLSSDSSCGFTGTGSLQNTNPKLGPLASNGGPTQTLALQDGSPAIDAIPLSANICPGTDQRGQGRPDTGESSCDMGAYEFADPADNDLGLSNMPADLKVNATSPKGAVVTYTPPTVVDESGDSSTASVSCTPASGSTFAIGTTKVTCTASDSDDTNSPVSGSFTVTVKGAAAQISDLITTVNSYHLSSSLQTALDNKLNDALKAINAGQTTTACSELTDFSGYVQSHTGKGITTSQATQLIAAAKQVQAVLGC